MLIGGLQKLSLLDYPDCLSTVVFTVGCNFRCHFCYNPQLVVPGSEKDKGYSLIAEDNLFRFLESRRHKLDAVVITGGEPTMQQDLTEFIIKIKKLGYLIKLDTNGTNPEMLKDLIDKKLLDYIAMDIKAPLENYKKVTGVEVSLKNIEKSIKMIIQSKVPYEFRTTVVPGLHNEEDIAKMGQLIKGADKWHLQSFRGQQPLINNEFEKKLPYPEDVLKAMRERAQQYVKFCKIR